MYSTGILFIYFDRFLFRYPKILYIKFDYYNAKLFKYYISDFTDSAFVTGLPISTFTNDANYLDSTTITGVVNNAYVRARQALIDSDLTKLLVDSAYIQLRDRFQDSSLLHLK